MAGHICVDLAPGLLHPTVVPGQLIEVGPLSITLGGSVANTGRALAGLGHEIEISTRVGADDLGRIVAAHLSDLPGVTGAPTITPGATTSYSIVLEPEGQDRSFWHHVGANLCFDGTEAEVGGASLVHLGYPSLLPGLIGDEGEAFIDFLLRVRAAGATTSVDLAVVDTHTQAIRTDWETVLRRAMPLIDVISPSADDLRSALGLVDASAAELVTLLLSWGAGVVAVSDGSQGITVGAAERGRLEQAGAALGPLAGTWASGRAKEPARRVHRITTTNGAGDASTAGLLSALLRRESLSRAAERATDAAVRVIEGGLLPGRGRTEQPQTQESL